ncbi:PDZ domain-containing protein [Candidatus Binatus sp.]|uniref:PDZ domain-containing protein n=1 Tax=Candidatus Binatus sp. TaxID=2811406 RepID=UPI002F920976
MTLEEALRQFARKRAEAGADTKEETAPATNARFAAISATVKREGDATAGLDLKPADEGANASARRNAANAGMPAGEEIVALIGGTSRTLEQLEQLEAAEKAYQEDFPASAPDNAEVADGSEVGEAGGVAVAGRHALIGDYAFTATGAALMLLVAFLIARVPIVNNQPGLVAHTIAMPALKASSLMSAHELITTFVIIPNTDVQLASAGSRLKSDKLEARIKDTLKLRAFPDIGVSVSKTGDVYLAGEVYSLDEARKIRQIVHRVDGVNRVHFLHPDVRPVDGPGYFGVTAASAPEVWGAKVQAVFIGSPADKAGIKRGDVISEVDGKTIPDAQTLNDLLAHYSPGQRVQFRAWHDGHPEYLVARLGEATTVASR